MDPVQEKRLESFIALMSSDGFSADDYDEGEGEEDPRPYLQGDEPIGRFVAVTKTGNTFFYYPRFVFAQDAIERAVRYIEDGIYEERPLKVVDLDLGGVMAPQWDSLTWDFVSQSTIVDSATYPCSCGGKGGCTCEGHCRGLPGICGCAAGRSLLVPAEQTI